MTTIAQVKDPPIDDNSEEDMEWDNSPGQIQLIGYEDRGPIIENDNTHDNSQDRIHDNSGGTSSKSRIPKLQRRNAIRRKQQPHRFKTSSTFRHIPDSPPQVSRQSKSTPTSPTQVTLAQVTNLNQILRRNNPLIPEAVRMDTTVQTMQRALNFVDETPRRSDRLKLRGEAQLPVQASKVKKKGLS